MNKPPRDGLTRPGPGEQDTPDVEGHGIGDSLRLPIDQGVPGAPGSDGISPLPRTGGEVTGDDDEGTGFGPSRGQKGW